MQVTGAFACLCMPVTHALLICIQLQHERKKLYKYVLWPLSERDHLCGVVRCHQNPDWGSVE